jgi:hypothetical protein
MDVKLINISQLSELCMEMWQVVDDINRTVDYHNELNQEDNLKSCLFYYRQNLESLDEQFDKCGIGK